jgi:hypothetical protein
VREVWASTSAANWPVCRAETCGFPPDRNEAHRKPAFAAHLDQHLMVQSIWLLPFQSDTYLVSHQAAQGRLADQRKATLLSLAASRATVVAVLVSIPYWRYLGLLPR